MPERGWSKVTLRTSTKQTLKARALARDLTLDAYIALLLDSTPTPTPNNEEGEDGWTTCDICHAKIKTSNYRAHMSRVHPRR